MFGTGVFGVKGCLRLFDLKRLSFVFGQTLAKFLTGRVSFTRAIGPRRSGATSPLA